MRVIIRSTAGGTFDVEVTGRDTLHEVWEALHQVKPPRVYFTCDARRVVLFNCANIVSIETPS